MPTKSKLFRPTYENIISQDEFEPKKNLKIKNWQNWCHHIRSAILAHSVLVKISIFVCSLPPCRVSREFYFPKMCSMTEKIVVINRGPWKLFDIYGHCWPIMILGWLLIEMTLEWLCNDFGFNMVVLFCFPLGRSLKTTLKLKSQMKQSNQEMDLLH